MSPKNERQAAQLVRIIRGEIGCASLVDVGIEVRRNGEEWGFPLSKLMAFPDVDDLAAGLIGLSSDAARLREWATFVLVASSLISLERLDRTALGRELLEELWELSSGNPVDLELLQRLKP